MKLKCIKGFTLIELVVVIALVGIVAGLSARIIMAGFLAYQNSSNLIDADAQVRVALERMQRDIRAVRTSADITTASAASLAFTDTTNNKVTYTLSGATLMRQTNSNTTQPLAYGISSLAFTYRDRNGAVTGTLANIRYISISLTVTQNGTNFTASTSVYPRNLL